MAHPQEIAQRQQTVDAFLPAMAEALGIPATRWDTHSAGDFLLIAAPHRTMKQVAWSLLSMRTQEGALAARVQVQHTPIALQTEHAVMPPEPSRLANYNELVIHITKHPLGAQVNPDKDVMLNPPAFRGHGIMSLMMDLALEWAQSNYGQAPIQPVQVSPVDATPDNWQRRDAFYLNHGFRWADNSPSPTGGGVLVADSLAALRRSDSAFIRRTVLDPQAVAQLIHRQRRVVDGLHACLAHKKVLMRGVEANQARGRRQVRNLALLGLSVLALCAWRMLNP